MTTKDLTANSDIILTLMLKDVAYNSEWGNWDSTLSTDFSLNYPATMYSTSYIRAGLLNGAVNYTTNGGNLVTLTATQKSALYGSAGYPFGIYTDANAMGSISNFLVKPKDVLYQQYENLYDISHLAGNNWYNTPNEASRYNVASSKWYTNGISSIENKKNYYDWGDDLIWLPSLPETGQNVNNVINTKGSGGLWNLDSNQRGVSSGYISWLRSGDDRQGVNSQYLDAVGILFNSFVTSTTLTAANGVQGGSLAVRPAR